VGRGLSRRGLNRASIEAKVRYFNEQNYDGF
jgi:hypothetical protein